MTPPPSYVVAFGEVDLDLECWGWEVPVKNTFINFDIPIVKPSSSLRSVTCPPVFHHGCRSARAITWEDASLELCHAMAPLSYISPPSSAHASDSVASSSSTAAPRKTADHCTAAPRKGGESRSSTSEVSKCSEKASEKESRSVLLQSNKMKKRPPAASKVSVEEEGGAISDVSTKESEGTQMVPDEQAAQIWTSVSSGKKKKAKGQSDVSDTALPVARAEDKQQAGKQVAEAEVVQRPARSAPPQAKGPNGRGLAFFQRIEVGIEDEHQFKVVKRLIGPRGKHVQDIVSSSKGATVWVLGKGSCSWLDSTGPLTVNVGSMSKVGFDCALGLVHDLLAKVKEDHRKFLSSR